jgi:cytochrome c peroxidase
MRTAVGGSRLAVGQRCSERIWPSTVNRQPSTPLLVNRVALIAVFLFQWSTAALADSLVTFDEHERKLISSLSPLPAPPRDTTNRVDGNPQAIALGKALFSDTRLSGDGKFSCASCHDPALSWTDGKEVAVAAGVGPRNTPSLWNMAHNRWYFWDGRADSLWSQAVKPIERNIELNSSRLQVAHVVSRDSTLRKSYEELFGKLPDLKDTQRFPLVGGPQASDAVRQANWWSMNPDDRTAVTEVFVNVGKAIAAFEGTILTGPAPFDRFVAELKSGKAPTAMSVSAQRGLKTFIGVGNCVLCHSGPEFTNKEFHDIRVPPRSTTEGVRDAGRGTGLPQLFEDEFVSAGPYSDDPQGPRALHLVYLDAEAGFRGHFKTPGLRNVAKTAPYMHAGQYKTLREVVRHYSTLADAAEPGEPEHIELLIRPFPLDEQQSADLVAFLESLTSE